MEKDCFEKLAPLGKISAYTHQGQWFPTDTLEKYHYANANFKSELSIITDYTMLLKKEVIVSSVPEHINVRTR